MFDVNLPITGVRDYLAKGPEPEMNRLLLIGNGFDLAHGMKTGYNDFILWYLKQAFRLAITDNNYEDDLMKVAYINHNFFGRGTIMKESDELVDYFYCNDLSILLNRSVFKVKGYANTFDNPFKTIIKSPFLTRILSNCSDVNWVVIENEFYQVLLDIKSTAKSDDKKKEIANLNLSMKCLIMHLRDYLRFIPRPEHSLGYDKLFNESLVQDEIVLVDIEHNRTPKKILALNFNYTSTVEQYLAEGNAINNIHGEVEDFINPMIFGFGDEIDKNYESIEAEPLKGFLTYIKSFWYFKTRNYSDLIRFIDSGDYQVCVYGHSCGLSDRTMLNMIFENPLCKSIKIFYHETPASNNYTEITEEISRHFKNKGTMREKLVSFERCKQMPQMSAQ